MDFSTMKMRGSAILIAIFLITAAGSVSFGIGRLFALESNIAASYENSTVAYYAAESGLEEGLLRYRYNKNTEMPVTSSTFDASKMSYGNLDSLKGSTRTVATTIPDAASHFYGMQMSYLDDYYGKSIYQDTQLGFSSLRDKDYVTNQEFKITRDNSIKLDVSSLAKTSEKNGGDLVLYVRPTGVCAANYGSATGQKKPFSEVKVTGITSSGIIEEKASLSYNTLDPVSEESLPASSMRNDVYAYSGLLNMVKMSNDTYTMFTNGRVELFLKPVGCDIYIGLKPVDSSKDIVQPFSTIKSIGYYGGVTRTLESKIDRQSGTVYDLFDFVLYSNRD